MTDCKEMIVIKIRIIGSCGSGKSTIAREISNKFGIPCFELDNLVWNTDHRYSDEERDSKLAEILKQETWIIEGVHYKWVLESFRDADLIIMITPNTWIRDYRIIRRFIRTRIGIESWNYKQSVHNLIEMMKWNKKYDQEHFPCIFDLTECYSHKRIIVRNQEDTLTHMDRFLINR